MANCAQLTSPLPTRPKTPNIKHRASFVANQIVHQLTETHRILHATAPGSHGRRSVSDLADEQNPPFLHGRVGPLPTMRNATLASHTTCAPRAENRECKTTCRCRFRGFCSTTSKNHAQNSNPLPPPSARFFDTRCLRFRRSSPPQPTHRMKNHEKNSLSAPNFHRRVALVQCLLRHPRLRNGRPQHFCHGFGHLGRLPSETTGRCFLFWVGSKTRR